MCPLHTHVVERESMEPHELDELLSSAHVRRGWPEIAEHCLDQVALDVRHSPLSLQGLPLRFGNADLLEGNSEALQVLHVDLVERVVAVRLGVHGVSAIVRQDLLHVLHACQPQDLFVEVLRQGHLVLFEECAEMPNALQHVVERIRSGLRTVPDLDKEAQFDEDLLVTETPKCACSLAEARDRFQFTVGQAVARATERNIGHVALL